MKKITLSSFVLLILITGCQKNSTTDFQATDDNVAVISKRTCGSNDVLQAQLAADPSLRIRMNEIESFTQRAISKGQLNQLVNGVINIPVVVNILYKTAAQNISDGQVQSQINVLNADYNKTNSDISKVPSIFVSSEGTVGVKFVLSKINRKATSKKSWSTNDAVKKTSQGGIDPTDPAHNLNLWACNLGQGLLGYAQFPGGAPATDGVVILYSAFGSRSIYPAGTYIASYDLGRTASHEVGHWMNLRHIWGDDGGACSGTDYVTDTPNQGAENYGCPAFPHVSCSNSGDMSMNYMDYSDDACMYMFSNGQAQRMLAVFSAGGPRAAIGQ